MQAQGPIPLRLSYPAPDLGDEDYSIPQDRSTRDAEIQPRAYDACQGKIGKPVRFYFQS